MKHCLCYKLIVSSFWQDPAAWYFCTVGTTGAADADACGANRSSLLVHTEGERFSFWAFLWYPAFARETQAEASSLLCTDGFIPIPWDGLCSGHVTTELWDETCRLGYRAGSTARFATPPGAVDVMATSRVYFVLFLSSCEYSSLAHREHQAFQPAPFAICAFRC